MWFGYCATHVINDTLDNCSLFKLNSVTLHDLNDTDLSFLSSHAQFSSASGLRRTAVTFQSVVELYVISIFVFVGILCNVVSVVVLRKDKERKDVLFFLQALAVADALYLFAAAFRYPLKYLLPSEDVYIRLQPAVFPLLKTFQTVAIWMMVLVTVDRYTCVCMPLDAPAMFNSTTRRRYAVALFFGGFLYNIPRYVDSCVARWLDPCSNRSFSRMLYRPTFANPLYYDIYIDGMYILFLYIGPLSILAVINLRLVYAIRQSRQRYRNRRISSVRTWSSGALMNTPNAGSDKNATMVLIIIVVVFIICETPELVLKFVSFTERNFAYGLFSRDLLRFNTVSQLLMVINSSVNFFVYLVFGRRFRRILKETFRFSFRFSSSGSALTHDSAVPVLQYHHNCIHVHALRNR